MRFARCEVAAYDEVSLTGTSTDGVRRDDFRGTVATVSPANETEPAALKVWPDDDQLLTPDERYHGKFWFSEPDVESIELQPDTQLSCAAAQDKRNRG